MRKKHKTLLRTSTITALLLVAFTIAISFLRITSFEQALMQLVESKTNGQYYLQIGKANFNFWKLTFVLNNVRIKRTDSVTNENGVRQVVIPSVFAELGSLRSFLRLNQIKIENLIIDEPYVIAQSNEIKSHERESVPKQLLKMFPAIEAVLERFQVKSLIINRGSFSLNRVNTSDTKLRLIDFLVNDWDLSQLDNHTQIGLKIGSQKIMLGEVELDFSSIEYRYPQHFLLFKDFGIIRSDSLKQSSVRGKSILMAGLDYNALFTNGKYKLRKIEIDDPVFTNTFRSQTTTNRQKTKFDIKMVAPLITSLFGEIELDSVVIHRGKLNLKIEQTNQEVSVGLSQFNFLLSKLKVIQDSSILKDVNVRLRAKDVSIQHSGGLSFKCDSLLFNNRDELIVTDVSLQHDGLQIELRKLYLDNTNAKIWLEQNRFVIGNIVLLEPKVVLNKRIKPNSNPWPEYNVSIQSISIKKGQFNIHTPSLQARMNGVDVEWVKIQRLEAISLLSSIKLFSADRYEMFAMPSLDIRGSHLALNEIELIDSVSHKFNIGRFHAGSIQIVGNINSLPGKEKNSMEFFFKDFQLDKFETQLQINRNNFSAKGLKIVASNMSLAETFSWDALEGKFNALQWNDAKHTINIERAMIERSGEVLFDKIKAKKENLSIMIEHIIMGKMKSRLPKDKLERMVLKSVRLSKSTELTCDIDSFVCKEINRLSGGKYSAEEILMYKPNLVYKSSSYENDENDDSADALGLFDEINKFCIYDANLYLNESALKANMIKGEMQGAKRKIDIKDVNYLTPEIKVDIKEIGWSGQKVKVRGIQIFPGDSLKNNKMQKDIIHCQVNEVTFSGVSLETLTNNLALHPDTTMIKGVQLNVFRDKTLEPPRAKIKPFLISDLLPTGLYSTYTTLDDTNITYKEVSDKTAQTGFVDLNSISCTINQDVTKRIELMDAKFTLFGKGEFMLRYHEMKSDSFQLKVDARNFDLRELNKIVSPLESIEIKNGYLNDLSIIAIAGTGHAAGVATMTYKDLQLQFHKLNNSGKTTLGNEILSFLANEVLVKNSKQNASFQIDQKRNPEKSLFNFWVKTIVHGSMKVMVRGKNKEGNKTK